MNKFSPQKQKFIDQATIQFGAGTIISNQQVAEASAAAGIPKAGWFKKQFKVGYNQFKLPGESAPTTILNTPSENTATMSLIATNMEKQNLVPSVFEGFVPWGHFKDIKSIVKSGLFYPIFVTGLSGNGKTLMIEQVHADMNKELIRVNITIETDILQLAHMPPIQSNVLISLEVQIKILIF